MPVEYRGFHFAPARAGDHSGPGVQNRSEGGRLCLLSRGSMGLRVKPENAKEGRNRVGTHQD